MKLNKENPFLKVTYILFILVCVCSLHVKGQVRVIPDKLELLMGRTATLRISVPVANDSTSVSFPLLQQAIAERKNYVSVLNDTVEILTAYTSGYVIEDGVSKAEYNITIQAFDSGSYKLPPFEFIVDGDTARSNVVALEVLPVKASADDPIDDFSDVIEPFDILPKNEEEMAQNSGLIWWLIGAAVLLLLAIVYLYIIFKKKGNGFLFKPALSPYQKAINRLKKLEQQNLPNKGKTKEYYTRLTDILRQYLRNQFGVKTLEKTSAEIILQVENTDSIAQYASVLNGIFNTSDFVKFAKQQTSNEENERCLSEARRFVIATNPESQNAEKGGEK